VLGRLMKSIRARIRTSVFPETMAAHTEYRDFAIFYIIPGAQRGIVNIHRPEVKLK
jgi:hypothetical protein